MHIRNIPFRFTSTTLSQSSSGVSTTVPTGLKPTLLKRQSSLPNSFTAVSTQFLASRELETSVLTQIAFPPLLLISSTVLLPPTSSMSATTTLAPFAAKVMAAPRPIPEEAPVTMVTLSCNENANEPCQSVRLLFIGDRPQASRTDTQ